MTKYETLDSGIIRSDETEGASDRYQCPSFPRICRCGVCMICGHGEHAAVHGPYYGQPPGSKPYGHAFVGGP